MIIGGKRLCGKTTELIKKANKDWLYIVCADLPRANHIVQTANKLGLGIPFPITVSELPLKSPYFRDILVDDIEDVLSRLINKQVVMASTSLQMKELAQVRSTK